VTPGRPRLHVEQQPDVGVGHDGRPLWLPRAGGAVRRQRRQDELLNAVEGAEGRLRGRPGRRGRPRAPPAAPGGLPELLVCVFSLQYPPATPP